MTGAPWIEPDTKDWTWVLESPCPECGFDPRGIRRAELGLAIRDNAVGFAAVLERDGVTERPAPAVWSATEYACHVRDVHRLFQQRLELMLADDDPQFENWDQDETAVQSRYDLADPAVVRAELLDAAESVAAAYDAVPADAWQRPGRRSNGSAFTVETLGVYHLHDVVHHLWDVTG